VRLISLCPSLTELVFDLGCGHELVGITNYCVHPSSEVGAIEKVGGTKNPAIERIVALQPDLVLMNDEENRLEDFEAMKEKGVTCLSSLPKTVSDTAEMVRQIGAALKRPAEAESIATDIEKRSDRVRRAASTQPNVTWAYLIWQRPLMTVNADTFAHDLLSLAGGSNVFADLEARYPEITIADLQAAEPDLVLLCTEPYSFTEDDAAALAEESCLPLDRFRIADGEYLSWHGSRTPDGIDYAESLIVEARRRKESSTSK
jgi:ABC-type Fe3+-hydroxamate transport system substrate-binding protein